MNIELLRSRIEKCFCREVSTMPEFWTLEKPAIGCDKVAAYKVWQEMGGSIYKTSYLLELTNKNIDHFSNMIFHKGWIMSVDLTDSQFSENTIFDWDEIRVNPDTFFSTVPDYERWLTFEKLYNKVVVEETKEVVEKVKDKVMEAVK